MNLNFNYLFIISQTVGMKKFSAFNSIRDKNFPIFLSFFVYFNFNFHAQTFSSFDISFFSFFSLHRETKSFIDDVKIRNELEWKTNYFSCIFYSIYIMLIEKFSAKFKEMKFQSSVLSAVDKRNLFNIMRFSWNWKLLK